MQIKYIKIKIETFIITKPFVAVFAAFLLGGIAGGIVQ